MTEDRKIVQAAHYLVLHDNARESLDLMLQSVMLIKSPPVQLQMLRSH